MRRKLKHPKRLCAADTPLLRARFAREFQIARHPGADLSSFLEAYENWLRDHGVEPETGRMTEAGLAFFKSCLEDKNSARAHKIHYVGRPTLPKTH